MVLFSCMKILAKNPIFVNIEKHFSSKALGIVGAPFAKGQPKKGVEKGPEALRKYGLLDHLKELDLDIKDYGDLTFDIIDSTHTNHKVKYLETVSAACQKVSSAVRNILLDDRRCLILGGDHSLGMGTVHGHSRVHDVCLLWIDAHSDVNTPYTTPSGHFHGMPCSFLVRELRKYCKGFPGYDWLNPCLYRYNITYIGLRDIDPLEKYILVKEGIHHFTMKDVDRLGIQEVVNRALELINPSGKLSLHVSFDIDSIDKLIAPSTGTSVIGGLTVREALVIAESVAKLDNFRALDLVEVNPLIGNEDEVQRTLEVAVTIIKAFFGHQRCGRFPVDVTIWSITRYLVGTADTAISLQPYDL